MLTRQWASLLVFLVSLQAYLLTLAPTVFGLDSAEFSAVIHSLGVPHATGYPLYVLLGKVFTYWPVGDVAYRLNLMSAVFAAGAVTVVYKLAFLLTARLLVSMAAAGFLAFSYYFWASAVVAEVYTLHAFLTAATIYLLLLWDRGGSNKLLYAAGFIWGLSFGNHMATALFAPSFAYLVASGLWHRRIQWHHVGILVLCFLPALGTYAYFPWRYTDTSAWPYVLGQYNGEGQFVRVDLTSLKGMWWMLTARQFQGLMFAHLGMDYLVQLGRSVWWLFANYLGVGFALGILGMVCNWRADRRRMVFLSLAFWANVLFFASYGALDKAVMLLGVYVIWAIWVAEGVAHILDILESHGSGWAQWRPATPWLRKPKVLSWGILALALPAMALAINFSYVDVSSDTLVRDRYTQFLVSFEPNALVLCWWPDSAPMIYLQQVEKMRPDVQVIDRFLISSENERRLLELSLPHRPVYVFGSLPALSVPYRAVPIPSSGLVIHQLIH